MYSTINDTIIFSDKATYLKNDEVIFTEGNSKAEGTNNTLLQLNLSTIKNKIL